MSHDAVLLDAFRNGEDIHTRTAAEVFGVPPLMVTPEHRRNAKAVNFGIVYGQTPFGLSQSLGIDRKEAEQYIRAYFERYSGVRRWLDADHRRRPPHGSFREPVRPPPPDPRYEQPQSERSQFRGAHSREHAAARRGGRSDQARHDPHRRTTPSGMQAKMLLQVHDELVLEAPPEEVDECRRW